MGSISNTLELLSLLLVINLLPLSGKFFPPAELVLILHGPGQKSPS